VRTVLVTGASTGIGRATALRLAGSGWTVLAGVRDPAVGEQLVAAADGAGRTLTPLTLDVTSSAQIAQATEFVREHTGAAVPSANGCLDALVNNAGIAVGGPLEIVDMGQLREQFEVNVFGQVAVIQALLPALRRARGRIVLVSSIGGRVAVPFLAPYNASKHALEAIGDALRVELRSSNIRVSLVEPGSVKTPMWAKGRADAERVQIPSELEPEYGRVPAAIAKTITDTERRGVPPERVAATIERALTSPNPRSRYLVGAEAYGTVIARALLPTGAFDWVIRRAMGV
jgi:NAD(P)-dependent dehydrogenase (short-subunit alcohol dehydrogenase family)